MSKQKQLRPAKTIFWSNELVNLEVIIMEEKTQKLITVCHFVSYTAIY